MTQEFIILGGGGHASVCIDLLIAGSSKIRGICDPDLQVGTTMQHGVTVLGDDSFLDTLSNSSTPLVNGIGSAKDNRARRQAYENTVEKGFSFPSLVHPSAIVSCCAELADGVQAMAGCVVQANARIASNTIINTRASIDHGGVIGEHCHIAPGAILCGDVQVGNDSHIGAGAVVVQGVRIGAGCFVAAGSTICTNVPDGARVGAGEVYKHETV